MYASWKEWSFYDHLPSIYYGREISGNLFIKTLKLYAGVVTFRSLNLNSCFCIFLLESLEPKASKIQPEVNAEPIIVYCELPMWDRWSEPVRLYFPSL